MYPCLFACTHFRISHQSDVVYRTTVTEPTRMLWYTERSDHNRRATQGLAKILKRSMLGWNRQNWSACCPHVTHQYIRQPQTRPCKCQDTDSGACSVVWTPFQVKNAFLPRNEKQVLDATVLPTVKVISFTYERAQFVHLAAAFHACIMQANLEGQPHPTHVVSAC